MRRGTLVAAVIAGLVALAGCGPVPPKPIVVKTVTVEVPKYIRDPIPPSLLRPCSVTEPPKACSRNDGVPDFCGGQLSALLEDYRRALRDCDSDKTSLRSLTPGTGPGK